MIKVPQSIILSCFLTFLFTFSSLDTGINNPSTQFYAVSLGASAGVVGLLFSLANINSAVLRIPLGFLMDKRGIKRIMTYAFAVSFLALLIALFSDKWEILTLAMLSAGLGDGILLCSQKYRISRSTNTDNRSAAFSLLFIATFSATLIGSTLSGALMQNYGFHLPLILSVFIVLFSLPLSLKLPQVKPFNPTVQLGFFTGLRNMNRTVWLMTLFKTSFNSVNGITAIVYPLLLRYSFNLDPMVVGLILTLRSAVDLLGLMLAGRVRSTKGRMNLLSCVFFFIPLFISFAFINNLFGIIFLMCAIAFFNGL
ncbi:MAG: MFS transporter, partial [Candidatus Bathyarchaeia archaeon]